jgi:hypothetical protein
MTYGYVELGRISAELGRISAEILRWRNFCRISDLVEFLQNFYPIPPMQNFCRKSNNAEFY